MIKDNSTDTVAELSSKVNDLLDTVTKQSDKIELLQSQLLIEKETYLAINKEMEETINNQQEEIHHTPVFFVKKKSGELRMVCDYRGLNRITIPDSNPLPLIDETLDQISGATVFSTVDLVGAYHQLRIKDGTKQFKI